MELKNKVKDSLVTLESNNNEIIKTAIEWIDFLKISKENSRYEYIEYVFKNIIIKIETIENNLKDDLYTNEDSFVDFFKAGLIGGSECFQEINKFILSMMELENEFIEDMSNDNNLPDDEKLQKAIFLVTDKIFFFAFKTAIFEFYNNMCSILNEVFDFADELYIYYGGDINLVNASKV